MLNIPTEVILSWPPPNYIDPIRRSNVELLLPGILFLTLATCSVFLRIWTRVRVRRWLGLDDILIISAWICSTAVTVLVSIGNTHYDWDRHIWDYRLEKFHDSTMVLYFLRILWGLSSSFTRLSVVCLYYRLLRSSQAPRRFIWIMHVVTIFNVLLCLYYLVSGIFPCMPISIYWTFPGADPAKCLNDGESMQIAAIFNTFAEFVLALLPLIAVILLHVNKRQRWGVVGVLSLGFLVALVGCVRTYYVWKVMTSFDLTWYSGPQWICSEIENNLAIICACGAPLRPVFGRFIQAFRDNRFRQLSTASSGTAGSNRTQRKESHLDAQDKAAWTSAMLSFDLEGISGDNFGYTVTITSPAADARQQHSRLGLPFKNYLKRSSEDTSRQQVTE